MDYKAMLIDLLGLNATATDEEIEAAFREEIPEEEAEHEGADENAKAVNRLVRLQAKRISDGKKADLDRQADAFCEQHKAVIRNRAEVRAQFVKDPAGTKQLFSGLKLVEGTQVKALDRAAAKTPAERDAVAVAATKESRKQTQDAEVSRIMATMKCRNRTEALSMAQTMNPALFSEK